MMLGESNFFKASANAQLDRRLSLLKKVVIAAWFFFLWA